MTLFPRSPARVEPAARDLRICFVGDSFVQGTGDPECLGWAGRVCARAARAGGRVTYYNLGVRRDTSADIQRRWRDEVACRLPPDVDGRVVLSFGTNDTTAQAGRARVVLEESLGSARAILEQAKSWRPLLVGPPYLSEPEQALRLRALSRGLSILCQELGVPFVEAFEALGRSAQWCADIAAHDGMHPRAEGYEVLAELVAASPVWQAWIG
ncbi:MAG TPA: GDSL-type esterase/lipase family protein [Myxococcota bacterium]|nr:GDSL-type esterase/lipase family protein [Myxococcota bacterium]